MSRRLVWISVAVVALALTIVLAVASAILQSAREREFTERVDALRAAGEPVSMSDLRPPEIPESENAAPLLLKARELLEPLEDPTYAFEYYDTEEWTTEQVEQVRTYVGSAEKYVELLHQAAAKPGCRFDYRWEDGPSMELAELPIFQDASRVLDYQVSLACHDGVGFDDAVRATKTTWRLSEFSSRASLIGQLLGVTIRSIACEQLERLANRPEVDVRALRDWIDGRLAAAEDREPWLESWKSERCMALWVIDFLLEGGDLDELVDGSTSPAPPGPIDRFLNVWWMRGFAYREGLWLLDLHEESSRLLDRDMLGDAAELEQFESKWKSRKTVIPALLVALPGNIREQYVISVAKLRVARAGLAVAAHHQLHGEWPEALPGTLPPDPYTSEPLIYRQTEKGVRIEARRPIADDIKDELERADLEIAWDLTR